MELNTTHRLPPSTETTKPSQHVLSRYVPSLLPHWNTSLLIICVCVCVCVIEKAVYILCVCFLGFFFISKPLCFAQLKSDLVKEVAYTRRKQHQASLQYYCALNALQYRKRIAMLEPMLGYTQAQVASA